MKKFMFIILLALLAGCSSYDWAGKEEPSEFQYMIKDWQMRQQEEIDADRGNID